MIVFVKRALERGSEAPPEPLRELCGTFPLGMQQPTKPDSFSLWHHAAGIPDERLERAIRAEVVSKVLGHCLKDLSFKKQFGHNNNYGLSKHALEEGRKPP